MYKKITKELYKATKWSGGTTTELFIYPETASYSKKDFLFRISSAKVEVKKSVFTKLPNISRKIMVLEGNLKLEHKNHHQCELKRFNKDSFQGDWETTSLGKAIDFNLMTTAKCDGDIQHVELSKNEYFRISFENSSKNKSYHYYLYEGKLVNFENDLSLEEKDSFVIFHESNLKLNFIAQQNSHLIISQIII